MAQFPSTPSNGDQITVNGITYIYNDTKTAWIRNSTAGANLTANSISITDSTPSVSTSTGSFLVTGGAGIQGNLYAGAVYSAKGVFSGPSNFSDTVTISGNLISSGAAQLNGVSVTGSFTYNSGTVLTNITAPSLGANSIIRTNSTTINEDITIPSGTNGVSAGPITIASGRTVTVTGDWSIV